MVEFFEKDRGERKEGSMIANLPADNQVMSFSGVSGCCLWR